jgi:hypothetical protein
MQPIQVIVIKIKRLAHRLIGLACAAGSTRKVRQRYCRVPRLRRGNIKVIVRLPANVQGSAGSHELPELAAEPWLRSCLIE